MDKTYDPQTIEAKCQKLWQTHDFYQPTGSGEAYCIMIPPPNVTGHLHMGHGFQYSLMDALIRFARMRGSKTLWQVGTDHAGISTQMVVERLLAKDNIKRTDIGREAFTEKVWQWKERSGNTITKQMQTLGISVDWSQQRFTLDADYQHAVQEVFIRLYQEGIIYRGKKLVNWDPNFQSAISDLEVISTEENGKLWHIRYPIVGTSEYVVVATTRPETMLGDVAVAVHPDDKRYQHLIGKQLQLPLTERTIPVIADDCVEQDFGSGCVKITPAHDFNDYEVGKRHRLALINIFTPDAKINENAPKIYQGLDRFVARKQILADLTKANLIEKIADHKLSVPRADRGNTIVEPYLTDQWFMQMDGLAQPALDIVQQGKIEFFPAQWQKTYSQWLENIEDWCISRQLWWGHRIPAWYDSSGKIYVGSDEASIRQQYKLNDEIKLTQDEDVLDTWFSSALWPFATLGWPQQTERLKTFYPTSVLVTGFDIIFFWVARMIMLGLKFMDEIPFKQVYFTGLIRDHEGQKMSKTKGNVIDPMDLIHGIDLPHLIEKRTFGLMQPHLEKTIKKQTEKEFPQGIDAYGTDAVRFNFCAIATTGRDIRFDVNRLEGYRNFCNKLWNAARYVLMNLDTAVLSSEVQPEFSFAAKWIQSRLQKTIASVTKQLTQYRFDLATQALYEFTWNEYCDWYLEFTKPILTQQQNIAIKKASQLTLLQVLDKLLRLMHPFMPFITEEIWQQLKPFTKDKTASIMIAKYPEIDAEQIDETLETEVSWLQQFITSIRTIRAEMNVSPKKLLSVFVNQANATELARIKKYQAFLQQLARLESITPLDTATPPAAATAIIDKCEILIPLKGLIDKDAEIERLAKQQAKLQKELDKLQAKLNNTNFISKAPKDLVTATQQQCEKLSTTLAQLAEKQKTLAAM